MDGEPAGGGFFRRRTAAFIALAAVVASGFAGWLAGTQIQSPAEAAARISPPQPSAILAPVERRTLSSEVITRGTARFGNPRSISLAPSVFKGSGIVTGLPAPGTEVRAGESLLSISGRPVFLLAGASPSYRDLGPGMVGQDVRQLEEALAQIGFDPGRIDGAYDAATGAAVASLYRRTGFEPVIATDEQLSSLRPASADLVAGSRAGAGVQMPADEVVFVASVPVRIAELSLAVGDDLANPVMTVTDAAVAVDGSLPLDEARLVAVGMPVRIDEPDLGIDATGVVSAVAERPGTNGADGFHVYFGVDVDGAPAEIVGASVRLTVPIESTSGEVLAVPVSALSLSADGTTTVHKMVGDAEVAVEVRPGLSAGGFVEVTPIGGTLAPGDQVVIGLE